tara:strand:+ start:29748 stop:29894 length:147 start_codon:yes stop_codon:yes gene_type:complete
LQKVPILKLKSASNQLILKQFQQIEEGLLPITGLTNTNQKLNDRNNSW